MTTLLIIGAVAYVAFLTLAWALCCAAARGDRMAAAERGRGVPLLPVSFALNGDRNVKHPRRSPRPGA